MGKGFLGFSTCASPHPPKHHHDVEKLALLLEREVGHQRRGPGFERGGGVAPGLGDRGAVPPTLETSIKGD